MNCSITPCSVHISAISQPSKALYSSKFHCPSQFRILPNYFRLVTLSIDSARKFNSATRQIQRFSRVRSTNPPLL